MSAFVFTTKSYQTSSPASNTSTDKTQDAVPTRCAEHFTCRLSHVILQERTLILLHCPSRVNSCTRSTSFHSILAADLYGALSGGKTAARGQKRLQGVGTKSDTDPNFPSRLPRDVQRFTPLALRRLLCPRSLPHPLKLIWMCSRERETLLVIMLSGTAVQVQELRIKFSLSSFLPHSPSFIAASLHPSVQFSPSFHLHICTPSSLVLSVLVITLQLAFCCSDVPLLPPFSPSVTPPFSSFYHFLSEGKSLHHSLLGL